MNGAIIEVQFFLMYKYIEQQNLTSRTLIELYCIDKHDETAKRLQ